MIKLIGGIWSRRLNARVPDAINYNGMVCKPIGRGAFRFVYSNPKLNIVLKLEPYPGPESREELSFYQKKIKKKDKKYFARPYHVELVGNFYILTQKKYEKPANWSLVIAAVKLGDKYGIIDIHPDNVRTYKNHFVIIDFSF